MGAFQVGKWGAAGVRRPSGAAPIRLVRNLPPHERGAQLHKMHGETTPPNFKTVDVWDPKTGDVRSIKSADLTKNSYQDPENLKSLLRRHIDKVAAYDGGGNSDFLISRSPIKTRGYDLIIEPGAGTRKQLEAIDSMKSYARRRGVDFTVTEHR